MPVQLLIIDPQNDFCDLPGAACPPDFGGAPVRPALPVQGAHADMSRLAAFVRAAGPHIDDITVTLDSHHRLHIAHPPFWVQGSGEAVSPFTTITAAQVRAGAFRPRDPGSAARALAYLDALEDRGRYTLMVWPVHCEIGSWGQAVHAEVRAAYNDWETSRLKVVRKVMKGMNLWTEHYSALRAEVPDAQEASTLPDAGLLEHLDRADTLVVAGEAGSHCVRATVEDLVELLPGGRPERIVLLTDCISPVGGFEAQQQQFFEGMAARGVRRATSVEMLARLPSA